MSEPSAAETSQIAKPWSGRDLLGTALIMLPLALAIPRYGTAVGFFVSIGVKTLIRR